MVAPSVDETAIWDLVAALLTPMLDAGVELYRAGAVPGADGNGGTATQKYVTVHLERRYLPAVHGSRLRSRTGWRMVVRAGANTARNAADLLVGCSGIEDQRLMHEGRRSTVVEHESSEAVRADDGKFSGSLTWTFTF